MLRRTGIERERILGRCGHVLMPTGRDEVRSRRDNHAELLPNQVLDVSINLGDRLAASLRADETSLVEKKEIVLLIFGEIGSPCCQAFDASLLARRPPLLKLCYQSHGSSSRHWNEPLLAELLIIRKSLPITFPTARREMSI